MSVIYLDYAATTPVDPAVAAAMAECLTRDGVFGNPASSTHAFGRAAAARVERAREQVAALIGASPRDVVFTSGATESNNLAILGIARANADRGRHLVTSRIEHKAVVDPFRRLEKEGFEVTWLEPDRAGRIDPAQVREALRDDTLLASIMHVNNETGVIQDIEAIGAVCRERRVTFHTDAAQSIGRLRVQVETLPIDLLSFTAHKLYGPKGIGALYVAPRARPSLRPILHGGGQERGLRPGTLPTHQIAGFAKACELAADVLDSESSRLGALSARLIAGLAGLDDSTLNGAGAPRVPHIVNVSFGGVDGESLVAELPGIAVSTGSACNSATGEPSYVLRALGRSSRLAQSSLRLSLGRPTTATEIDAAIASLGRALATLRAESPAAGIAAEPAWLPAGAATGRPSDRRVVGEAGSASDEVWIRFQLLVEGEVVRAAHVQALGCPATRSAARWVAERLSGRSRADLVPGDPHIWARELGVPPEKLGRLLMVEDALRSCLQRWPRES